jgi:hypothetical protein
MPTQNRRVILQGYRAPESQRGANEGLKLVVELTRSPQNGTAKAPGSSNRDVGRPDTRGKPRDLISDRGSQTLRWKRTKNVHGNMSERRGDNDDDELMSYSLQPNRRRIDRADPTSTRQALVCLGVALVMLWDAISGIRANERGHGYAIEGTSSRPLKLCSNHGGLDEGRGLLPGSGFSLGCRNPQ